MNEEISINQEDENTFKISVPIITNEELERVDYKLETEFESIISELSTSISRDREIIFLKRIIKKIFKKLESEYKRKARVINFIDNKNTHFEDGENWENILKIKALLEGRE